ncbi:1 TM domain-containing transmembrane protein [Acrasis kona]|uniref:1 TM domain-containing transmembrane protein n=1 Tax=Acrasis kona TaxID=1008807 RepID=A0AAW2Z9S5_9EUKA
MLRRFSHKIKLTRPISRSLVIAQGKKHHIDAYNISKELNLDFAERYIREDDNDAIMITEKTKWHLTLQGTHEFSEWLIVAYAHGSVCFFNVDEASRNQWVSKFKDLTKSQSIKTENLTIEINPNAKEYCEIGRDRLTITHLDKHALSLITGTLARSAALKSYEDQLRDILHQFQGLNSKVKIQNKMSMVEVNKLTPVIALGNELKCGLLITVRLLETPDIIWDSSRYDKLYKLLNNDFEIGVRYTAIEKKLDFIQENAIFYLDMRHSHVMNRGNWSVIFLLAASAVVAYRMYRASIQEVRSGEVRWSRLVMSIKEKFE